MPVNDTSSGTTTELSDMKYENCAPALAPSRFLGPNGTLILSGTPTLVAAPAYSADALVAETVASHSLLRTAVALQTPVSCAQDEKCVRVISL